MSVARAAGCALRRVGGGVFLLRSDILLPFADMWQVVRPIASHGCVPFLSLWVPASLPNRPQLLFATPRTEVIAEELTRTRFNRGYGSEHERGSLVRLE